MMKFIIVVLSFIFSSFSHSTECNVDFYAKVFKLSSNAKIQQNDIIKKSNCAQDLNTKIVQLINSLNGTIGSDFILKELNSDQLKISPNKISILDFNTSLREQLNLSNSLVPVDLKTLNRSQAITLDENESISLNCDNCNSLGEKNFKATITDSIKNTEKIVWVTCKLFSKTNVIKAKRSLNYQLDHLTKDDFYEDVILTASPENIVTSLENIQFYKVNRSILQGAVLSHNDLLPVNLVNFGTPANVLLKTQNINLQRMAIPSRPAKFGEIIELKNISNGKMISGKVIDYNKVVIEL